MAPRPFCGSHDLATDGATQESRWVTCLACKAEGLEEAYCIVLARMPLIVDSEHTSAVRKGMKLAAAAIRRRIETIRAI